MTQLQTTPHEYDPIRCGEMFHKSGMFPDTKSAAQCATKLIVGQGMGLNAYDSMSGLNIIQGKVCLASNLMAAAIKRHPKYDYRSECDNERCKIIFYQEEDRPGHGGPMRILGTTIFKMEDAKRAGLGGTAWTKYPSAMLFARCISKGYREHCPDALGNAPVYVEAHGEFEIPKDPQPAAVLPSSQTPTPARKATHPAAVKQVAKEEPMLEQLDESEPVQAEETWRDHVETPQDEGSSLDQWLARDAYDPNTYVRDVLERPLRTGTLYIVKIDQPIADQNGPTGDRQINEWTTFDTKIGEAAKELQRKVASVTYTTNINGKYCNITSIEELAITEPPPISVAKTKTKTKTKPKSQIHLSVTDDDIPF